MSALGNLFGSGPKINYTPGGFSGGGLGATFSGGKYNIAESPGLSSAVGSLQATFGQQATALGGLAGTVQPGFSLGRQAGLADIENSRLSTLSNLRDTLAQRRIMGSSFANSQVSQTEADFAKQKADFEAQSYLQELEASNQLIQEQFQAATSGYAASINQMNLEAGLAAQLTQSANSSLAAIATAQAQLDAQNAAGAGKLIGTTLAVGAAPFTGGASLAALPALGVSGVTAPNSILGRQ